MKNEYDFSNAECGSSLNELVATLLKEEIARIKAAK